MTKEQKARAFGENQYARRLDTARFMVEHYKMLQANAEEEVRRLLASKDSEIDWEAHKYELYGWGEAAEPV